MGVGCDGTNFNVGTNGFRGYIEESVPWAVLFSSLVNRLELSLKDTLEGINLYNTIDDMLMHAYYLYENHSRNVISSIRW